MWFIYGLSQWSLVVLNIPDPDPLQALSITGVQKYAHKKKVVKIRIEIST